MGAFGCLFGGIILVFFLILAFGLLILQKVLSLFGIRIPIEKIIRVNMGGQPFTFDGNNPSNSSRQQTTTTKSSVTDKKQMYADDEGEYVEFEEIKD